MSCPGSPALGTCRPQSLSPGAASDLGGFGCGWARRQHREAAARSPSRTMLELVAWRRLRFSWWSSALARSPSESSAGLLDTAGLGLGGLSPSGRGRAEAGGRHRAGGVSELCPVNKLISFSSFIKTPVLASALPHCPLCLLWLLGADAVRLSCLCGSQALEPLSCSVRG